MIRSRVRWADALAIGAQGMRARRVRSALSALGIAVAIAALVAVLGIASSAKANLLAQLGAEGNLLTIAAGQSFTGSAAALPMTAEPMIRAIPPVENVTAVAAVPGATVRRSAAIPAADTSGITLMAAQSSLLTTLSATLVRGQFLPVSANRYPEIVLGYAAAQNLGLDALTDATQVYVAGRYFVVVGILAPVAVAPEIDDFALISFPVATSTFGITAAPTRIYLRTQPDQVGAVAAVLPFTAAPQQPEAVQVRRPSDILLARIAAKTAFVGLFVALGAVALLVGAVGVANIMVIAVLERRGEIGLRRALGARGRHIAGQFLLEATTLAGIGGALGGALGIATTAVADRLVHNPVAVAAYIPAAGFGAALLVGAIAGLYPALKAARLAPAAAIRAAD